MSRGCKSCEAEVIWCTWEKSGKPTLLDANPTPHGNLVKLPGDKIRYATAEDKKLHRPLYTSHFATCPQADQYRK